jgi:archaellum component FlaC|tara:strand:- start:118 stop:315 length:198 start_codon:yes stop_codon:yes gene_type:complete
MSKNDIKQYRGLIRKDIDEVITKLNNIDGKLNKLNDKLEKHINFIDDTYEGLKNPIKMATSFFKR